MTEETFAQRRVSLTYTAHVQRIKDILDDQEPEPHETDPEKRKRSPFQWAKWAAFQLLRITWCSGALDAFKATEKFLEEHGDELSEKDRKDLENSLLDLTVAIQGNCPGAYWP